MSLRKSSGIQQARRGHVEDAQGNLAGISRDLHQIETRVRQAALVAPHTINIVGPVLDRGGSLDRIRAAIARALEHLTALHTDGEQSAWWQGNGRKEQP